MASVTAHSAVVSAWPALALAGSFELLMALIRTDHRAAVMPAPAVNVSQPAPLVSHDGPVAVLAAPSMEHTIRTWHSAGHSQRAIARGLNIDRRKVKRVVDSVS